MELWFTEYHTESARFSIRVDAQLHSEQSEFQKIDVFSSPDFGRFLVLDGYVMFTQRDEFIYHEMIAHVPMAVHPGVEKVLLIGAGDGGVARELLRYEGVRRIDLVEIDRRVVEVCREYFPFTADSLRDERVRIHYRDGIHFVRTVQDAYDLIIVDSTDPFGPGEALFSEEFYRNCFHALREDGIMVNQHESPFYPGDALAAQLSHRRISKSFETSLVYQAHIPTYPSGHWLFGFASKRYHPLEDLRESRWEALGIPTRYYNLPLHRGCFALPNYVQDLLLEPGDIE